MKLLIHYRYTDSDVVDGGEFIDFSNAVESIVELALNVPARTDFTSKDLYIMAKIEFSGTGAMSTLAELFSSLETVSDKSGYTLELVG